MAHSEKLSTWLLDNADRVNLRVTEMTWVRDWNMNGLCDLQATIDVGGQTFVGRGTALSEDLAFIKAGAEAIERAFCFGLAIHTTGVAVHTDAQAAQLNAKNEFNERDAFFCHFYTKTPFLPVLNSVTHELMQTYKNAIDKINSRGITIRFFRARAIGYPVYLCVASGLRSQLRFGGIVGLGSQNDDEQAIQSAFFECLRNVVAILVNGAPAVLGAEEFLRISKPTSSDRQRLALNPEYWKEMSSLFPEALNVTIEKVTPPSQSWSWATEKLECPFDELRCAPVIAYRATLDVSMGKALFYDRDHSPTTLLRLQDFLQKPIEMSKLESRPHFLG